MVDINSIYNNYPYYIKNIFELLNQKDKDFFCYLADESVLDYIYNLTDSITDYYFITNHSVDEVAKKLDIRVGYNLNNKNNSNYNKLLIEIDKNLEPIVFKSITPNNIDYLDSSKIYIHISSINNIYEYFNKSLFNIYQVLISKDELIDRCNLVGDSSNVVVKAFPEKMQSSSNLLTSFIKLLRLKVKYGFIIDNELEKIILNTSYTLKTENIYRLRNEFIKIFLLDKPSECFELLREYKLLNYFLSELLEGYGVTQNEFHLYDVYYHSLYSCDASSKDELYIRIAALLHDIGKPASMKVVQNDTTSESKNTFYNHEIISSNMAKRILNRLKFNKDYIESIVNLIKLHMFHYTPAWSDAAIRRFLNKVGIENLPNLLKLRDADRIGSGKRTLESKAIQEFQKRIDDVIKEDSKFKIKDLDIDGNDIMRELNLTPSPIIGKILNSLLEKVVLDIDNLNKKDVLIKMAKEIYASIK